MAIIDKITLKNDSNQDVVYDIGAASENIKYDNNISIKDRIDEHIVNPVNRQEGVHGLRYVSEKLQYFNDVTSTWVDIASGGGGGGDISIIDITVAHAPYNTEYYVGNSLNLAGVIINANYNNGTIKDITNECSFTPNEGDTLTLNDTNITVRYSSGEQVFTKTIPITVREQSITVTKIQCVSLPKTTYVANENFDYTGLVVMAYFSDGTTLDITNHERLFIAKNTSQSWMNYGQNFVMDLNTTTITLNWSMDTSIYGQEYFTNISVTVLPIANLTSISLTHYDDSFYEGDAFDPTPEVIDSHTHTYMVTATFSDGTTKDVTSLSTFTPSAGYFFTRNDNSITASYTYNNITKQVSVPITIIYVSNIEVNKEPTKKIYSIGENLNTSGVSITAHWTNGNVPTITQYCRFSPANGSVLSSTGVKIINVYYKDHEREHALELSTSFTVQVVSGEVPADWATGSDSEIASALQKHYNDEINLYDFWSVGDKRSVEFNSVSVLRTDSSSDPVEMTIPTMSMDLVLWDIDKKELTTPITNSKGNTHSKCAFVIGTEYMYVSGIPVCTQNDITTVGGNSNKLGWGDTYLRNWLNTNLYNAIKSSTFKGILKQFKAYSIKDGDKDAYTAACQAGLTYEGISNDYITIPAWYELVGTNSSEERQAIPANECDDLSYFNSRTIYVHKILYGHNNTTTESSSSYYWLRSPFGAVSNSNTAFWSTNDYGQGYHAENLSYALRPNVTKGIRLMMTI